MVPKNGVLVTCTRMSRPWRADTEISGFDTATKPAVSPWATDCWSMKPLVFSADETTDIGYESGTTVSSAYTAATSRFTGKIAAIVQYEEEVEQLRKLGANAIFYVYDGAGQALADSAMHELLSASAATKPAVDIVSV